MSICSLRIAKRIRCFHTLLTEGNQGRRYGWTWPLRFIRRDSWIVFSGMECQITKRSYCCVKNLRNKAVLYIVKSVKYHCTFTSSFFKKYDFWTISISHYVNRRFTIFFITKKSLLLVSAVRLKNHFGAWYFIAQKSP